MTDEGYIKFNCNWIEKKIVNRLDILELNFYREKLFKAGLIGMYENGIGFGNLSIRYKDKFLISGSATGGLEELKENHYAIVTDYDLSKNSLTCEGMVKASSESLTHAVVYECSESINAVIHVHNLKLWRNLLFIVPTTKKVEYGTLEMANEIKRLFKETNVEEKKVICMLGHEEGIITFGKNLKEAKDILYDLL